MTAFATGQRRNTLFFRAVTSILSQRLMHRITNSSAALIARLHVRQDIAGKLNTWLRHLPGKFVKCTFHNISCAQEEGSLHSR